VWALQPVTRHDAELEFSWNEETGGVTGREMAIVLGQFWRLEGDLAKAYPRAGHSRGADRSNLPELNRT
jgi:hypothetical protein